MSKIPSLQYYVKNRHATWLELFFDLVFVASISVITHHLAHVHDGHIEGKQILLFFSEFIPVWWIWATHTLYSNRFDTESRVHRLASLLIMFLMTTLSALLGEGLFDDSIGFISFYILIRLVIAGMYFTANGHFKETRSHTQIIGKTILGGIAIAAISIFFGSPIRQIIFLCGIGLEMIATAYISTRKNMLSVHRSHIVERVGLLSIIILGESVIGLVSGLSGLDWNYYSILAALTGFLMIGAIWWIYFDSFNVLERAKYIQYGFALLYSNVLTLLGLGILSSLIRHAILNDLAMRDFQLLAIVGMSLFYLGKQITYYLAFPIYRINLLINTIVCISVTTLSTFLPRTEYVLIGMTLGMFFYVYSNFKWTLTKDVTPFLIDELEPS